MTANVVWRPLHHSTPFFVNDAKVHFFLVNKHNEKEKTIPCGAGLGVIITGMRGEVTCCECLVESDKLSIDYFA